MPLAPCYYFPVFHAPDLHQIILTASQYVLSIRTEKENKTLWLDLGRVWLQGSGRKQGSREV